MKRSDLLICLLILLLLVIQGNRIFAQQVGAGSESGMSYKVRKLNSEMVADGNWNKRQWKKAGTLSLQNFIRERPAEFPEVRAKMMYTSENLYVIFKVNERYIKSITTQVNGPVWKDSAVEFFFSPDTSKPEMFFNLEVNAGGTHLLSYRGQKPAIEDVNRIEIGHSLPDVVDPEITVPTVWTIELKIPLDMLAKYSTVTQPRRGVNWKANFYKIAEITSNPHYLNWSPITHQKANFHMPQFFGTLMFQ